MSHAQVSHVTRIYESRHTDLASFQKSMPTHQHLKDPLVCMARKDTFCIYTFSEYEANAPTSRLAYTSICDPVHHDCGNLLAAAKKKNIRDVTHSCVTWVFYVLCDSCICDMTLSYVMWLIQMSRDILIRIMTHCYVAMHSYVTWLIHV